MNMSTQQPATNHALGLAPAQPNPAKPSSALGQPPVVAKKKLTPEEKKAKADAETAKKKEKEDAKQAREKAKQDKETAKAAKLAEKAAEKAKVEAEKKARHEEREKKKREREEEEKRTQGEKERKERSQLRLGAFFSVGPSTPKKSDAATLKASDAAQASGSPEKGPNKAGSEAVSEYERMFKPFFVKEQVTLASLPFANDAETREAKTRILDEYVAEARGPFNPKPFNHTEVFSLAFTPPPRGRLYPSVRKIMAAYHGESAPIDLTTESQNSQIQQARRLLKEVPMRFLGFKEDVRPPYYGTITTTPRSGNLRRLARKPTSRDLLPLNYDYDSEAEWVDDGDGEDIDDMEDEEDEMDDDEEMGDFLDDSEDTGPARAAFSTGMAPESTGLCWENRQRLAPLPHLYKYRMEIILGKTNPHLCVA